MENYNEYKEMLMNDMDLTGEDLDSLDLNLGINLTPILIILAIGVVSIEWIMYKRGA